MTREEVVNSMSLQDAIQVLKDTNCYGTMDIAKTVILKALEQEPCDDCISRKEVIKLMEWGWKKGIFPIYQIIALPSVTPAEKQEPRENVSDINDGNIYECPCGYGWDKSKVVRHHFCPNCGRKVQEAKE